MKRLVAITLGLLVSVMIGVLKPESAESKIITNVDSDISGEELKAVVIDDFETGTVGNDGWTVTSVPKKYDNANATTEKKKRKNPVDSLDLKFIQGEPNDLVVENWSLTGLGKQKQKCLGVHFKFKYPGYNSVHIIPPPEISWNEKKPVKTYNPSLRQDVQENGIQLPGRAKGISMWVHGRGNPYTLEVWVKDYKGNTHILKFGTINFVGWRPLTVYIPAYIPQSAESYPITRVTKITRFVIRSSPDAKPGDVFVFFDQLKVLTDIYEVNFDGHKLHEQFSGGKTTKTNTDAQK